MSDDAISVSARYKRVSIPKSIRFEVFKRDSFKCQYCGHSAPDVVLEIDHIQPIAGGGDPRNIVNLITACKDCNAGKSDRLLSDDSAAKKRKNQLDDLQARREQLEMMAKWQLGLVDLTEQAVQQCADLLAKIVIGYQLNSACLDTLRKHVRQFGVGEVLAAIPISARYLETDQTGRYTTESVHQAWSKIGGICVVQRRKRDDPELDEIYKIRAGLMRRISTLRPWDASRKLDSLRDAGYSAEEIRKAMANVDRWWSFEETVEAMLEGAR